MLTGIEVFDQWKDVLYKKKMRQHQRSMRGGMEGLWEIIGTTWETNLTTVSDYLPTSTSE